MKKSEIAEKLIKHLGEASVLSTEIDNSGLMQDALNDIINNSDLFSKQAVKDAKHEKDYLLIIKTALK